MNDLTPSSYLQPAVPPARVFRKQLLNTGASSLGDFLDDPHGFALAMKDQGGSRIRDAEIAGDPPLGQLVLVHDSRDFFRRGVKLEIVL